MNSMADRRSGIGGSDAGPILGVSPWKTPFALWQQKVGEVEEEDQTDVMYFGTLLEDVVASEYVRRTGKKVRRRSTIRHPKRPWQMAHIDRDVVGEKRLLECKTAGTLSDQYGEDGSDQLPLTYVAQVQHYMEVMNYDVADVAVFFLGPRQFRIYEVARDRTLGELLTEKEAEFWQRVLDREPPDPTTLADVRARWPRDSGAEVEATPEVYGAWEQLHEVKAQQKTLAEQRDSLEFLIHRHMGDATTLTGPDGQPLATWKTQNARRLDQKRLKAEMAEIVRNYTVESTTRVFRLK